MGCSIFRSPSPDITPHLISIPDDSPYRPIDGREGKPLSELNGDKSNRERIDELYAVVVYDGKKPVFQENDPLQKVYDRARAVLDRYVLNAWHDSAEGAYNTVHAIHDFLVCNVKYDFSLYEEFNKGNADAASDPAFHIDGVFLNGLAVCDGLSRAFDFLCAIEGIESVRVTGSLASTPHAWNKVKLFDKWYNLDVTSDAAYYTVGGSGNKKQLSHGYFLLSDDTISSFRPNGHAFADSPCVAEEDFDYYAEQSVSVGRKSFAAVVKSQSELNRLFSAINAADGKVGKIEVKLDFVGKTQVNEADMYAFEIAAAYRKIDDSDFVFASGSKPYFRYPNGVYMFLIYK